jgi:transcriptional regulator
MTEQYRMNKNMAIGGLGNGLDSLFNDNISDVQVKKTLRTSEIEPNRDQPRKNFSDETIATLADSIREHGMLQPILVRPIESGGYQIVAGERRWRAARMLGLDEVPVNIKELSDLETMQIAIIENLQRENLNPVEEASGYNELIEKYGMTQEKVAKMVGRSRSAVANSIRLLSLPERVLNMLENGDISAGHARALLGFDNEEILVATAIKASDGGLTVRQVEKAAQKSIEFDDKKDSKKDSDSRIDSYFVEVELSLKEKLGRKVKVDYGKNKGALILEFYDKDDLTELANKLAQEI